MRGLGRGISGNYTLGVQLIRSAQKREFIMVQGSILVTILVILAIIYFAKRV